MTALTKQDLLAIIGGEKPTNTTIDGFGEVLIKKLTVKEQSELAKLQDDGVNATLHMVAFSLCDEDGKRLFSDKEVSELGKMSADQLAKLASAISEANGFNVEDAKKN
ncbi:phage tail assembly chaperone family protein, TAC [Moraxella nasicaprae]|uniref:Phage tail assembly chaperone family protein, TAC n=1 Tax=Moraxella nasicaprae TaxID=2904122 RepID=A0ABY6F374_9GAMM|nr:phage tail assembly chaperone family protein, TAC [Moraxella nasicaprae]UXZ04551.1 phage tail assembly chaperone family protein, TAC [Moraxella nasicaprae]